MPLKHSSVTILIPLLSSLSGHLFGQAVSGTIVGTVHDASGAVVVGTRVTATSISTGIPQTTTSGTDGDYTISNLPPGDYKIAAQMNGFTTAVAARSTVQLQQTTRVDFTLNPGVVNQEVNVTGAPSLVQSTTSDLLSPA